MTAEAAFQQEVDAVLADPVFVRSPVLTRLLVFLVDESIADRGTRLKSYSVAVDGLGRGADFDPQVDSYARVQVARLRKSLDAFYAGQGSSRPQRLQIDSGTYRVDLVPNPRAITLGSRSSAVSGKRGSWSGRLVLLGGLLLGVGLLASVLAWWLIDQRAKAHLWQLDDFPSIEMTDMSNPRRDAAVDPLLSDAFRQSMLLALTRYESLRVRDRPGATSDYELRSLVRRSGDGAKATLLLVHRKRNRVIWTWTGDISRNPATNQFDTDKAVSAISFMIGQPTGVLHANERNINRNHGTETPYACWLGFVSQLQDSNHVASGPLIECATAWFDATPNNPLAAGLHSWVLIDRSTSALTETARNEALDKAIRAAETTRQLNPGSMFAELASLRAYAFARREPELLASAHRALKLNPDNMDAVGMVGMMLVLDNRPEGLPLLHDAIARHFNPPAWYFIGIYMHAMMQEDVVGARMALERASALRHSMPIIQIMKAALEARTGHLATAQAEWKRAKDMVPALRIKSGYVFDRLPVHPALRQKLLSWLGPVLE